MITLLNKFDDNYVIKPEDVYDIVNAYIRNNSLEPYLKDISFDPTNKNLADYNLKTNEIVFNDNKIILAGYSLYDELYSKYHINEEYYTYFLNFYYLFIIYHELVHVSQKAKYERDISKDNIFNYLYELSNQLRRKDINLYYINHNLFPMEIEANNEGYLYALNLMNHTKLPRRECRVMQLKYLSSLSLNYRTIGNLHIISPVEEFVGLDNETMERINTLFSNTRLSKNERMNLGLFITLKEYKSIMNEKRKCLIRIKK